MARSLRSFLVPKFICFAWLFCFLTASGAAGDPSKQTAESGLGEELALPFEIAPGDTVRELKVELTEESFIAPFDWTGLDQGRKRALLQHVLVRGLEMHRIGERIHDEYLQKNPSADEVSFRDLVERDEIDHLFPDGMRGEITTINGQYVARIIDIETRLSFYLIPKNLVKQGSRHLKQIIARQHIDAGKKRKNGSKPGRDTVMVWLNGFKQIENVEYFPRSSPWSKAWIQDYWTATWKGPPTVPDMAFGAFCAALQTSSAACVALLKHHNDPTSNFDYSPMIVSAIWAFGIASNNPTYRNWLYRGSEASKIGKMWLQSMGFAMHLYWYSNGVWSIIQFNLPAYWFYVANAVVNSFIHNQGRRAWYLFPEIRTWHRDNLGNLKVFGWDTGLKRASFEQQMIYFVPYTVKLAGLAGVGAIFTLPLYGNSLSFTLDGGTAALLASVPFAQAAALTYAYAKGYEGAGEYAREFGNYWLSILKAPVVIPLKTAGLLYRAGSGMITGAGKTCAWMLSRK